MPICDDIRVNNKVDYKQKYIHLKRKLKLLIYENESYSDELRKSERQLLQVSRDKSFLLDRLLQYEKIESSTSGSEDTLSSDSEVESRKLDAKKKKTIESVSSDSQTNANTSRKKKANSQTSGTSRARSNSMGKPSKWQSMATQVNASITSSSAITNCLFKSEMSSALNSLTTCSQSSKASVSSTSSVNSTIDGHMTSEELERHLESRRQPSALLMPEKTPLTVPVELFSNESSNGIPEEDNHLNVKLTQ